MRTLFFLFLCSLFLGAWGQTSKIEEDLEVVLPISFFWVDINQNEEMDYGYDIIHAFKEMGEADLRYFPNGWKDSCIALFTFPAESGLDTWLFKEKGIKIWLSEDCYFVRDKEDTPLFELIRKDGIEGYLLSVSNPKIFQPSEP